MKHSESSFANPIKDELGFSYLSLSSYLRLRFSYLSYVFVSIMVALLFLHIVSDSLLKNHLANACTLTHALILCFFSPLLIEPSPFVQNSRLTASSTLKKHTGKIHRHQPCIPYSMRGDSNNYVSGRRRPDQATVS